MKTNHARRVIPRVLARREKREKMVSEPRRTKDDLRRQTRTRKQLDL